MKYKILKQQGFCHASLPEQEKTVALASTTKKLKDHNLKLSQQVMSESPYWKQDKYKNKGKNKGNAKEVTSTKSKI
eukprot:1708633-Ditylum_brightwellii.AAC.1